MCGPIRVSPEEAALHRWIWSARWQLTRFAQENYARRGRGITVLRSRTVPALPPDVESVIPPHKLTYHTPEAIRALRPRKRVTVYDLRDWMGAAQHYNPSTHWVGALIVGNLHTCSLRSPLTTRASDARARFSNALSVRPLELDVVRRAARAYYDELVVGGYTGPQIEATGRQEMSGYRYAFTAYDKAPTFGLQVAATIAEGFRINWRLVKDLGDDPEAVLEEH